MTSTIRHVLDFSEVNGTYLLPYEFRAIELDEHQEQEHIAEQNPVDKELQSSEARNQGKENDKVLESYLKA